MTADSPLLCPGDALVIASNNAGKVREIAQLLEPFALRVVSIAGFGAPEPEETGTTFAENAEIKARAAMEQAGMAALADDSGLGIPLLGGAPGIHSARWAGPDKDFIHAMQRIEAELAATGAPRESWHAYFICDLCLCLPDGRMHHFEGRVDGRLSFPPRGENGFGYDPIFIPEGGQQTFAEMPVADKQAISHRARAFARLTAVLGHEHT